MKILDVRFKCIKYSGILIKEECKLIMESNYEVQKLVDRENPQFDRNKIMQAIRMLIEAIGDDPEREGLKGTPDRVARMYEEIFEGMRFTNDQIAEMFGTCFESDSNDLVIVKNIPIFSYCEHHMALMYDMEVSIGYIPNGKVIGLSKISRVAEMVGKRLQLQERIGNDIAEIIQKIAGTENVIVVIEGEHSCMTTRGIKSRGSKTKTATLRGIFKDNVALRNEFYNLINQ
jgi:GTP cyclohydrolase I